MRILAVRGKNLASLERFDVEFESGPLEHAGIFAITGPTGAGKTTLLDALCVALFDRTPRLSNKAGVPVGTADQDDSHRVRANDVRGILRRGAADGFAEVEFVGRDQRRYLARWSVHRSRRRATGKLQASEVSLTDVETEVVVAGKKTETLAAIEDKLGLSFEQFRRSALLAQNDFAAFLRADEKQRSDLLERMTGTDIYTKVSIAAYRRAADEAKALGSLQDSADASAIMDDETRAELVTLRDGLRARHKEKQAAKEAAGLHVSWFSDVRKAGATIAEARKSHEESQERVLAQSDVVEQIERVREARDKRSVVDADVAARTRFAQAKAAEVRAGELELEASEALGVQKTAQAKASEAVEAARVRYLALLNAECARIDEQRASLTTWLAAHSELASSGGEAHEFFEMAVDALDLIAPSLEEDTRALERRAQAAKGACELALAARTAANKERESLACESAIGELAALREADALLVQQAAGLQTLLSLVRAMARASLIRENAENEKRGACALAEKLRTLGVSLEAKEQASAAVLAEAQGAFDRIRLALDLADHRASLVADEHCPLCGSVDHPWRENDATASVVGEQEARVDTLRRGLEELRQALGKTQTERLAAEHVHSKACQEVDARTLELQTSREEAEELVARKSMVGLRVELAENALVVESANVDAKQRRTREKRLVAESLEAAAKHAADVAANATEAWERASETAQLYSREHQEALEKLKACQGYRYRTRDAERSRLASAWAVCEEKRLAAPNWVPEVERRAQEVIEASLEGAMHALVAAKEQVKASAATTAGASESTHVSEQRLQALLEAMHCSREELLARLEVRDTWIATTQAAVDAAKKAMSEAAGRLRESEVRRVELEAHPPPGGLEEESAIARQKQLGADLDLIVEDGVKVGAQLLADEEARKRRDALGDTIATATERVRVFRTLSELIGSADGKKFRIFAQSLTLDSLLEGANAHLKELAPRYLLQRVPGHDLDLQVVDRDLADEVRSVNSLSGGESFLISLALALGLSSLASKDVRVESLLIDEGFGSLDGDTLEVALSVLDSLQATGRKVGLISHVPGFAERIGAQVIVTPKGGGRSSVHVQGPMSYR